MVNQIVNLDEVRKQLGRLFIQPLLGSYDAPLSGQNESSHCVILSVPFLNGCVANAGDGLDVS